MIARNYYIDYGEVTELGERIGNVMAEMERLMEEASAAVIEMEKTAEQIPAEAEYGGLKYACMAAKEEIGRTDFGFYGQRVRQGLERFLEENEWIRNCFVKDMDHNVERIVGFKATCRNLMESLEYKKEDICHWIGIRKTAGHNTESVEGGEAETLLYWPVTREELLREAAGKLAGFRMDHGANSPEEGEKMRIYQGYLDALRRGDYSDVEIAGILASIEIREGNPVINSGTDSINFYRYKMLLETALEENGLPPQIYDCGVFTAYSNGRATEEEVCRYIDCLMNQMYICERDYTYLMGVLPTLKNAIPEAREGTIVRIGELFDRRRNVIDAIKEYYPNRTRAEVMFYVQISLMMDGEYDDAFVAGVVGNMMGEGVCGQFENANYETHPEEKPPHLVHVSECIDYMEKYQGHNVTQVDLAQLYYDVVCVKEECGYVRHGFGLGSVQWSFSRTEELLEYYLAECGYDVSGEEFQEQLEEYRNAFESGDFSEYEGIYINEQQVRCAEAAYILYELGEEENLSKVYSNYSDEVKDSNNPESDVLTAARIVMEEYINPRYPTVGLSQRQEAAEVWYSIIGGGNL